MVQVVRAEKTVESWLCEIPYCTDEDAGIEEGDSQATMRSDSPDTLFKVPSISSADNDAWTWG